MRPSPSTKKRHQYDKFMQSKLLITSHSINPLSQHISTKLDLIKQQISRQFHQKYPSDKKRSSSMKKSTHSSKSKLSQKKDLLCISKKLNFSHVASQPSQSVKAGNNNNITQGQEQNQTYRDKFFDLQDKFISERKKMIDDYQKNSNLKQKIFDFLQEPSIKTAEYLYQFFTSDRHKKIIDKFISMHEDIRYAQKTLMQILQIMQTEDIQTLLQELRNRQSGYKSLSQCTLKILQLQTNSNRQQKQFEQKLNFYKTQNELKQKQLRIKFEDKIKQAEKLLNSVKKNQESNFKRLLRNLISDIEIQLGSSTISDQSEVQKSTNMLFATFDKFQTQRQIQKQPKPSDKYRQQKKLQTSLFSIQEQSIQKLLHKILYCFRQMQSNILQIQKEAEQNIQKLMISKLDMDRLQKLIQNVTYETEEQKNRLIEHFQLVIQQKSAQYQQQLQKLSVDLKQKDKDYNRLTLQLQNKRKQLQNLTSTLQPRIVNFKQKNSKQQKLISQILAIFGEVTGEVFNLQTSAEQQTQTFRIRDNEQIFMQKIKNGLNKHLMVLKQNLQAADNMVLWQEKQLQIKQGLLKQFDFNLKRLMEQGELIEERSRKIEFERDQYKYLLTNLRQNIRQIKIQHQQQLIKLSNQKDQQYLNINKDILIENKRLNQHLLNNKKTIDNLTQQLNTETVSHAFHRKKSQQLEINIAQLRKKLLLAESEAAEYKQHLCQIQISFKQVQNMSQINSHKMMQLQNANILANNQVADLRIKMKNLLGQIQEKDEVYNKLQFKFDQLVKRCDRLSKNKQDLQQQNSNLRLKSLETMEETRQQDNKLKKIQLQNISFGKQNKKLMQQVNSLTKKLLAYVGQKNLINKTRSQIRQQINNTISTQFQNLKNCFVSSKNIIKDYLQQCKAAMQGQFKQIKNQMQQFFIFKQIKQKQIQNRNEEIKNIQLVFDDNTIKQNLKIKKNEQKIQKINKKLNFTKEQLNNFKEYCQYVKSQFYEQKLFVAKLIKELKNMSQKQQIKLGENQDILIKAKLGLNSLRNQNQSLKQEVETYYKQNVESLIQFKKVILQNLPELVTKIIQRNQLQQSKPYIKLPIQKSSDAQLSEIQLRQFSPTKNNFQHQSQIKDQYLEQQLMSPQFVSANKQRQNTSQCKQDEKFNYQNQNQIVQKKQQSEASQKNHAINSERVRYLKTYSFKQTNSGIFESGQNQMNNLRWSDLEIDKQQAQRVKRILISLKDNDGQQPKIPYFGLIKQQYRAIKQKLLKNLALDISAVSFRHNTIISSPSSISFSKDFLIQKRFNTEPNQQPLMVLVPRSTNRSQYKYDHGLSPLVKQNEQLKQQVQRLDQQIKIYEYRQQQYKITITELQKKKIQLQNQASKQMKQKLMVKFLNDLCKESWKQVESSCKILLKLLGFSTADINQKLQALRAFINKHEKKNTGFMGGLFQKNPKN